MPNTPANGNSNGVLGVLARSGDRAVQLGTLGLVAISGLGNFWQGEKLSQQSIEDRDKAVRQIQILYDRMDGFQARQMEVLSNQKQIMDAERQILERIQKDL